MHLESAAELTALARIAAQRGRAMRVGIRVNPDVTADTHPYIATGQGGIKFGVPFDQVVPLALAVAVAVAVLVEATIVVLVNGRPFAIPWIAENIPALVEAWLPGEEGAQAIADVLFGDVNPGGEVIATGNVIVMGSLRGMVHAGASLRRRLPDKAPPDHTHPPRSLIPQNHID